MTKPASEEHNESDDQNLRHKAFGPAANEFGKEIAPLGRELGAVTSLVAQRLILCVRGAVYGFDQVGEWLRDAIAKRLKDSAPEDIVEPSARIAVPATQALVYSMDDENIREMFANLLASDMTASKKTAVHPAFVESIKQMTSSDAKILGVLVKGPQIRFVVRFGSQQYWSECASDYSFECDGVPSDGYATALDNLQRLGLVEVRRTEWPILPEFDVKEKEVLDRHTKMENFFKLVFNASNPPVLDGSLYIARSGIYLTTLGLSFSKVCLVA